MKTALNQLIENINLMIEMAEIDKIKATEVNSFTLKARSEGQIQAFNMMLKEIEQLLPTEREQIINARQDGHDSTYIGCDSDGGDKYYIDESNEQYFNQTYNE